MNTPAHAVINLLLLTRDRDQCKAAAIMLGAVIPDLVIIVFYAWHLILGTAEAQIWSIEYFSPWWQGWIDSFNSIPIIVTAMAICWYWQRGVLCAVFSSMLLHVCGDLPLHHDDAHRHFYPLLDWRFASPISYWDPAHFGHWFGLFEMACVLGAAAYLYRRRPTLRWWVFGSLGIYVLYWIYVYLVWL